MVKGWIIGNGFLSDSEISYQIGSVIKAASQSGIDLKLIKNTDILAMYDGDRISLCGTSELPEFALFWNKDIRLAYNMEQMGVKLFNNARAIEICDDKALTHQFLARYGIRMPKTIFPPKTYDNVGYTSFDFLQKVIDELGFPMVIKECSGSFGFQVYKADDIFQLRETLKRIGTKPFIFQEFIGTSAGRDLRIYVVGDHAVAAGKRSSCNDFRANVVLGGSMEAYKPTDEEAELAIRCSRLLNLDFAGVDILWGENDEPILCEVNSNAHTKKISECTGTNVNKHIIDYILSKIT